MIYPGYRSAGRLLCQVSVTGLNISGINTSPEPEGPEVFCFPPRTSNLPLGKITGAGNFFYKLAARLCVSLEFVRVLALKSNISTVVVAGSVALGEPPTSRILPFSEVVF